VRLWPDAGPRWAFPSSSVRATPRAQQAAASIGRELGVEVSSGSNRAAAEQAGIVVVTVPYAAQSDTLTDIRGVVSGKVVVDTTVPLVPPKVMRVQLPPEGAAALRAQRLLGDGVRVVSAFHNVAAHKLAHDETIDCDVLVFGDDKDARAEVVRLGAHRGQATAVASSWR
jgi:NADPH-dependent F420 reductase